MEAEIQRTRCAGCVGFASIAGGLGLVSVWTMLLCKGRRDTESKRRSYWNGSIAWISSGEIQFCRVKQTKELITELGFQNSSTQINPIGSVLIGMIGEGKQEVKLQY